jgi:hypothetical protein
VLACVNQEPKKHRARNQICRNKFFAQKENIKESHPHIAEWFDNEQSRALQTEIIEKCFKKSAGEWKFDLDKPFFTESKKRCVSSMEAYIEL